MGIFDGDIFTDTFDLDGDGELGSEDELFGGMLVDDLLRETGKERSSFDDGLDDPDECPDDSDDDFS